MKFNTLMSTVMAFAFATPALAVDKAAVLGSYADIAAAKYEDSLITAKALQAAVDALIFDPSAEALQAAKSAWLTARVLIPTDRGLPLWQRHCGRLGGQGERMAFGRGSDRLCRRSLRRVVR
jgi:hypothetical protein